MYPITSLWFQKDQGAPLVCRSRTGDHRWYLVGIASWMLDDCSSKGNPAVFTDVIRTSKWINETVENYLRYSKSDFHVKFHSFILTFLQILRLNLNSINERLLAKFGP